jgi:acyl carrier protein
MLDQAALEARILRMFTGEMNLPVADVDTDLIEAGILDSLVFVDLLFRLEKEFGIAVSIESVDADQLRTVRSIAKFVRA